MVGADEGFVVWRGDVLALHYRRYPNVGLVASYDDTEPHCCGMTDDKLSLIHNDATYDDMLPLGKILTIKVHYTRKKRLPALKPLLYGKYILLLFDIFNMLWWYIWVKITLNYNTLKILIHI